MVCDISEIENPVWQDQAACKGVDPAIFFVRKDRNYRRAKEFCNSCLVRDECLEYALSLEKFSVNARAGIVAGLTPNQRNKITVCIYGRCTTRVKRYGDYCPEHS